MYSFEKGSRLYAKGGGDEVASNGHHRSSSAMRDSTNDVSATVQGIHHVKDSASRASSAVDADIDIDGAKYKTKTQMAQAFQESQESYRSANDRAGLKTVKTRRILKKTTTITRGENQKPLAEIVDDNSNFREILLRWAQRTTEGYPGVKVTDLTTSWRDGLAFNAIIHRNRPDLLDYRACRKHTSRENLENAFHVAERDLGVTRLLDPEDVDVPQPDEKSIITYLAQLYELFPDPPENNPLLDEEKIRRIDEYKELASRLLSWIKESTVKLEDRKFPKSARELKALLAENDRFRSEEVPPKQHDKQRLASAAREVLKMAQQVGVRVDSELLPDNIEYHWQRMIAAHEARQQALLDALARAEKTDSALHRFNVKLDALKKQLDELERRLDAMAPPARDPKALRRQLDEMRDFESRLAKTRRNLEEVSDLCDDLIRQDLAPNPKQLREGVAECKAQLARIEAKAAKRMRDLEGAMTHAEEAEAAMNRFNVKLDALKKQLDELERRLDGMDPPAREPDALRRQIEEMRDFLERLAKVRHNMEEVSDLCDDLIRRDLASNPKKIREDVAECRAQLARIEAKAAKRMRDLEGTLSHQEKVAAAMSRFNVKIDALKKLLDELEHRLDNMDPPARDPEALRRQIEEMRDFESRLAKARRLMEEVSDMSEDLIRQDLASNPKKLREDVADCRAQLARIEAKAAKRMRDLEGTLSHQEKVAAAMSRFNVKIDALKKLLDELERRLDNMDPPARDPEGLRRQLDEMREFETLLSKARRNMEEVSDLCEDLIRQDLASNPKKLREDVADCRAQLARIEAKAAKRMRDLESALSQIEEAEAAMKMRVDQFERALQELLAWMTQCERELQRIRPGSEMAGADADVIEAELGRLRLIINDIEAHAPSVESLNRAGRTLIESNAGGPAGVEAIRHKLDSLNTRWQALQSTADKKLGELEDVLTDAIAFDRELADLFTWLQELDQALAQSGKPVGGLPETAREQLNVFMELWNELETNRPRVEQMLAKGAELLRLPAGARGDAPKLAANIKTLRQRWEGVQTRAAERKTRLEQALREAEEFQAAMQAMVDWLTSAENYFAQLEPVSRLVDRVTKQIEQHKQFARDVNAQREPMLELDKRATHLKYFSQKQDVIVIKNLLASVTQRWERVLAKTAERTRALEAGHKEAKEFADAWHELMQWLTEAQQQLADAGAAAAGTEPEQIKALLAKHKEYQRALGAKQAQYDNVRRMGRALKEKAPRPDQPVIQGMLDELKNKWNAVCEASVERQRRLEEALLYSGQFKDACAALIEWLDRARAMLLGNQRVHGDLDTVTALVEQHRAFKQDFESRAQTLEQVRRTAAELMASTSPASSASQAHITQQMAQLESKWSEVARLSDERSAKLDDALRMAQQLHEQVHALLEWLADAEMKLRFAGSLPDDIERTRAAIADHDAFMSELAGQIQLRDATLQLARSILEKAHPDAEPVVKHWIAIIESRWNEIEAWAQQRGARLAEHLRALEDIMALIEQLIGWLVRHETRLVTEQAESLPSGNIARLESMIVEHQAFIEELRRRETDVDRVVRMFAPKSGAAQKTVTHATTVKQRVEYSRSRSNLAGTGARSRTPSAQRTAAVSATPAGHSTTTHASYKDEYPDVRQPRARIMLDKWRAVWQLALDKMQRIRDAIDYERESERLEHFDFDEWRRRYLSWINNNRKARIMDFYRSIDKDNDGRVPDAEFVDAFLKCNFTTSRLEMEKVVSHFDKNKDGFVDHKEYLDALRPDRPITEEEIIQDEVQRQVSKCTCTHRYKVYHVGEGRYRFGESQKLRLVRILRSIVMVRVGGGWVSLDEFLSKNDPCRVRGRTNVELREQFILPDGASQAMATFKSKMARDPSSLGAGPITKIREKTDRSIPMSGTRLAGSPSDYYSETDSTVGLKSRPRSRLTPPGAGSRPASATQEY